MDSFVVGAAVFAGFLFSVVVHECAHGLVALWLGDPTARDQGRITLDPLRHIDPIMSILVPLMLWLSGLPMFGGAKPVPVDMTRLRRPFLDMMWVALAGPVANLLLAAVFAVCLNGVPLASQARPEFADKLLLVIVQIVLLNVYLALFNLLPIPPLDGGRIAAGLLPSRIAIHFYRHEIQVLGLGLVMFLAMSGKTAFLGPWTEQLTKWIVHIATWIN